MAVLSLVAFLLSFSLAAFAQSGDDLKEIRKEIEGLKQGQTAIQKEIRELKDLLRARPSAQPAEAREIVLSAADAPTKGEKNATVTLFEFSDYQ